MPAYAHTHTRTHAHTNKHARTELEGKSLMPNVPFAITDGSLGISGQKCGCREGMRESDREIMRGKESEREREMKRNLSGKD